MSKSEKKDLIVNSKPRFSFILNFLFFFFIFLFTAGLATAQIAFPNPYNNTGDVVNLQTGDDSGSSVENLNDLADVSSADIPQDEQALVFDTLINSWTNKSITAIVDDTFVKKAGDTMTGTLNLESDLYVLSGIAVDNGISVDSGDVIVQNGDVDIGAGQELNTEQISFGTSSLTPSLVKVDNNRIRFQDFEFESIFDIYTNSNGFDFNPTTINKDFTMSSLRISDIFELDASENLITIKNLSINGQYVFPNSSGSDGQILVMNTSTGFLEFRNQASGGGGSPGGSDTYIQYNDGGAFEGSNAFVWDNSSNTLVINNPPSPDSNTRIHVYDDDATQMFIGETNQTGQGVEALQFYQNPTTPVNNMGILNSYYIKDSLGNKVRASRIQFAAADVTGGAVDGNFGVFLSLNGVENRVLSLEPGSIKFNDGLTSRNTYIYANSGVVPGNSPLANFHGGTGDIMFGDTVFFVNQGSVLTLKPRVAGDNALKFLPHASQSGDLADFGSSGISKEGISKFATYTDTTRPSPGDLGRYIWNTDDNAMNIDNSTDWVTTTGTIT